MKPSFRLHRWLTASTVLMAGVLVLNLIGLLLDGRTITGAPAWLKPAKFALSTAIYAGTLAWLIARLDVWPRLTKLLGNVTALALTVEIAIINLQAWRGTTSHFNISTPLNAALFSTMGVSIALLWIASLGLFAALMRQRFANQSLGWALRLGMLITVLGSALGGAMVDGKPSTLHGPIGAHTVGAPDGGAGIPVTGWSRDHGDLRIAHFMGLHGIQAMLLAYWILARKRRPRVTTVTVLSASYFSLAALFEWQALRGQSITEPDTAMGIALLTWLALTSIALVTSSWAGRSSDSLAATVPSI